LSQDEARRRGQAELAKLVGEVIGKMQQQEERLELALGQERQLDASPFPISKEAQNPNPYR
jgi:hypothetical protein